MSVCEYHMRLFLMDCRLALACMQHAADGESKQSITASPLVVSSLLSSLPLPSVSHEHLHFKNSLIKMNVSFSSLAGGYKDAPWIRQDRSALNLQVLKRKKTVIEPQLVCNFCKWALWQPKSKWVYYIMQSNSENIGNHYRPVTRFIQSTNFPFNISCPVLLTRFKVSWYSWPSPPLCLLYTGRMKPPVALHLSCLPRWSHSPWKPWLLLLQTISPDVLEQDPTFGPLVGLNWRTATR